MKQNIIHYPKRNQVRLKMKIYLFTPIYYIITFTLKQFTRMKHITQTIIENSLTELNRTELIVTLNHYYLRLDISNSDYWTLLTKINNNELTQMDELQKKITKFTL